MSRNRMIVAFVVTWLVLTAFAVCQSGDDEGALPVMPGQVHAQIAHR